MYGKFLWVRAGQRVRPAVTCLGRGKEQLADGLCWLGLSIISSIWPMNIKPRWLECICWGQHYVRYISWATKTRAELMEMNLMTEGLSSGTTFSFIVYFNLKLSIISLSFCLYFCQTNIKNSIITVQIYKKIARKM